MCVCVYTETYVRMYMCGDVGRWCVPIHVICVGVCVRVSSPVHAPLSHVHTLSCAGFRFGQIDFFSRVGDRMSRSCVLHYPICGRFILKHILMLLHMFSVVMHGNRCVALEHASPFTAAGWVGCWLPSGGAPATTLHGYFVECTCTQVARDHQSTNSWLLLCVAW